jgi:trimethylamine--corrinoid protein Co-methyltransferase
MRHCNKPILTPVEEMDQRQLDSLKLFQILYGDDDIFEKHYVTWHPVCSASPYCYPTHATDGIRLFAERNQPVVIVSAPMSGITSPVHLYSTVVLAVAEFLAGIVYAQLIRPGVPVVPSASLTYGNMRYATWECAAPDTALLLGGMIQLYRDYYKLPARAQTGVTSSKAVDYQAGLETMQSFLFTALCGVNLTSQSVGSLANLLTLSPEKTVIDNELISRVRYILRGMGTGEDAFDLEDMLETEACGDFMTAPSTIAHFRDGWQPSVSDWRTYDAWAADGSKSVQETATDKVNEILAEAPETILDAEQEKMMTDYIRHVEKRNNLI